MVKDRKEWTLAAVAAIAVITVAWWALALWPLPADTPVWLERARAVCFNTGPTGLPTASGWILLIGQPLGMVALLVVGWRRELGEGMAMAVGTPGGRAALMGSVLLVLTGATLTVVRVRSATATGIVIAGAAELPDTYPRLDRAYPATDGLVDQNGESFSLASLGGRGALITFAFAHCETICPVVVRNALAARDAVVDHGSLAVVVFTLDPWRDTPSRLPGMAEAWGMAAGDFVLSGSVEAVEKALEGWNVARERDGRTGDVSHPALVYLVEPDGTVAYASTGVPSQLEELARRMEAAPLP
ncbi:MAG: SCO family protein [Gemmatimonadota bacterium]|nr:SCO family protein [Gemmatimonadota bacterium]